MRWHTRAIGLLAGASLVLAGCSSVKVVSFENPRVNFADFQEYSLKKPVSNTGELSAEGRQFIDRLENTIKEEMGKRGYELTYSPDLEVSYDIVSSRQRDTNVNRNPFWYNPWFYGTTYNVYQYNYTESIVMIEMKDLNTGKIAWQGSLDLRYTRNSKKKDQIIPEAIQNIFKDYPYVSGSNTKVQPEGKKRKRS